VCRASAQHASAGCVQSAGTAREPGAVEIGHFSAYSGLRHTGCRIHHSTKVRGRWFTEGCCLLCCSVAT
jgi:hypothetical protein